MKQASKTAKTFAPAKGIKTIERGNEFIALRKQGVSVMDIIDLYKKKGIKVTVPSCYSAMRLAEAPAFIHEAIAKGEVKSTGVLPLLGYDTEAAQRKALDRMIAQRKAKAAQLAKAGYSSEGRPHLTKARTIHMVGQSLQKIRESGALKNANAKALLAFIEALEQNKSVKELIAPFVGK